MVRARLAQVLSAQEKDKNRQVLSLLVSSQIMLTVKSNGTESEIKLILMGQKYWT